jgi:uncharacterized alkaline shock family protein YloU
MADGKEYISRNDEMGSINISEDVLAVIAAVSAGEVDGVGGIAAPGPDLTELFLKKSPAKRLRIQIEGDIINVDASILVKYGYTIPTVAKAVQEAGAGSIEAMTGITVGSVNVQVAGVVFDRQDGK